MIDDQVPKPKDLPPDSSSGDSKAKDGSVGLGVGSDEGLPTTSVSNDRDGTKKASENNAPSEMAPRPDGEYFGVGRGENEILSKPKTSTSPVEHPSSPREMSEKTPKSSTGVSRTPETEPKGPSRSSDATTEEAATTRVTSQRPIEPRPTKTPRPLETTTRDGFASIRTTTERPVRPSDTQRPGRPSVPTATQRPLSPSATSKPVMPVRPSTSLRPPGDTERSCLGLGCQYPRPTTVTSQKPSGIPAPPQLEPRPDGEYFEATNYNAEIPTQNPQRPQRPQRPQKPQKPQRPQPPQRPQRPQRPLSPQAPLPPQPPQPPQSPQSPQPPSFGRPERPQRPQKPRPDGEYFEGIQYNAEIPTTLTPTTFSNDDDNDDDNGVVVDPDLGAELSRNFSACIEEYTECVSSSDGGHEICKKAFDKCSIGILLESRVDSIQGCDQ